MNTFDTAQAFRRKTAELSGVLESLPESDWELQTPAEGWSVTDQVAHLSFVFDLAAGACSAPAKFKDKMAKTAEVGFDIAVSQGILEYKHGGAHRTLERFRAAAQLAASALETTTSGLVPWLVNPLPPAVLGMAGMLETFAHGQDVLDTVGLRMTWDDDLEYLVHFVARTRDFGYRSRGLEPPVEEFRFVISLPSDRLVDIGPPDATNVVQGSAEDLALLASRRRHPADLGLVTEGQAASGWLDIAQAYRGPAGAGRQPGQFQKVKIA